MSLNRNIFKFVPVVFMAVTIVVLSILLSLKQTPHPMDIFNIFVKESSAGEDPTDLSKYEMRFFSQNGEDGVLLKLIAMLYGHNIYNKYFVEFGVEDGSECNTRVLRSLGWNGGLLMDGGNENDQINLRKEFVTRENIVTLFKKHNVPERVHVLSVDIDFNDFYCLHEILKTYTCDIIICEYNSIHGPGEDKIVVYDDKMVWDGTDYFGASLLALVELGKKHGYTLVYCDRKGVNSFFVRDGLVATLNIKDAGDVEKIYRPPRFRGLLCKVADAFCTGGHPRDPLGRQYVASSEIL